MISQIQTFYRNKIVFITGGSGFLGRVIIEKLLRSTEVERIYVLIRPKKGVSIKERINNWNKDPLFSVLFKLDPKFVDRVVAIAGDCALPDLGISVEDRKLLVHEVQIVIHSAATVRFDEPLNVALNINTRGTLLMVQLAKEMIRLESFVYVSTAFSNCGIHHIKETYYPENLSCSFDKVLELREIVSNDLIDNMTPALLGQFPNTYTFTKALAEQIIQREATGLPACIFRPSMILATYKEPVSGWVDNLAGPMSILYAVSFGVLRVLHVDLNARTHVVPVDYCANMVLATAWQAAKKNETVTNMLVLKEPTIYNYTASEQNPINWKKFIETIDDLRYLCPLEQTIWYPYVNTYTSLWAYELAILFYHILPGYIFDFVLRLRGENPRLIKIYDKIHSNVKKVSKFATTDWTFDMHNTDRLMQCMSPQDRKLFECDMKDLIWNEYFSVALPGIREYLGKEKPTKESIHKGRKTVKRFYIYYRIIQTVVYGTAAALIWMVLRFILGFFY